ncbi:MAG: crossover junction endodeoxyribonuclease RuvC [Thermodesulfovibrionales bacterium]
MTTPARNRNQITILGIDPGSVKCGYGLVAFSGPSAAYLASGTIAAPAAKPIQQRLRKIYEGLLGVIREHRPDEIVIEKIFFAKGVQAALSLGQARGIALLAAAIEDVPVQECSALQVKKSVAGYGHAEKEQVQKMVKMILNVRGTLAPDSADALALALCYGNAIKFTDALHGSQAR